MGQHCCFSCPALTRPVRARSTIGRRSGPALTYEIAPRDRTVTRAATVPSRRLLIGALYLLVRAQWQAKRASQMLGCGSALAPAVTHRHARLAMTHVPAAG